MSLMDPGFEQYMATPIGGAFMEELNKIKMLTMPVLMKAGPVWLGLFLCFCKENKGFWIGNVRKQ